MGHGSHTRGFGMAIGTVRVGHCRSGECTLCLLLVLSCLWCRKRLVHVSVELVGDVDVDIANQCHGCVHVCQHVVPSVDAMYRRDKRLKRVQTQPQTHMIQKVHSVCNQYIPKEGWCLIHDCTRRVFQYTTPTIAFCHRKQKQWVCQS